MTPAARIQASIEILDEILAGTPAEKSLTGWARRSRFAGSKDRAAIRDHVFDALRCKRSFAALGGAETGRGLMIGLIRAASEDPTDLFTGARHAPLPVGENETGCTPASGGEENDLPDWLWSRFQDSLGDEAQAAAQALRHRAPVHLRVNRLKSDLPQAVEVLARDGIEARSHSACDTALEIVSGARLVAKSRAFLDGLVELQDAASQAVVASLPLRPGLKVLDYCAGGGGKSLALAASRGVSVFAHDISPVRMSDIPARAQRAGVDITLLDGVSVAANSPYDIVLVDAPCSGSGSWRRAPAGKWALTPERLTELCSIQQSILSKASVLVSNGGQLAYATCSMLREENQEAVGALVRQNPQWSRVFEKLWLVSEGTDGFYTAHLTQNSASR